MALSFIGGNPTRVPVLVGIKDSKTGMDLYPVTEDLEGGANAEVGQPSGGDRAKNESWSSKKKDDDNSGELKDAPIFTLAENNVRNDKSHDLPAQFGLIGTLSSQDESMTNGNLHHDLSSHAPGTLAYANMDIPWSAFICGSQGAGKSYTLSCLLENGLLKSKEVGNLQNPLAGLVLHYDNYTNGVGGQVCEASYLCSANIPVTVLVSPSNIWDMTRLYTSLPGLPPGALVPTVAPLYLPETGLDVASMLKLMAVDPSSNNVPLYMETLMSILREMAMEGKGSSAFSYSDFRQRLNSVKWAPGQLVPLNLRLQLLDSFLEPSEFTKTTRPAPSKDNIWSFKPGSLTIIDLSDPFMGSDDACSLFSICISLFMADRGECGRVIALDEAHKFLSQSGAARTLTTDLTSIIRQQRHTGTRVLIATQEPTLSPDLLDLSNVTIIHRFRSPAWYEVLRKHLAGISRHDERANQQTLFEMILNLETGQALAFCPTAMLCDSRASTCNREYQRLGSQYIRMKVRKRLTSDGGESIRATEQGIVKSARQTYDIPMHVVDKASGSQGVSNTKKKSSAAFHSVSSVAVPSTSQITLIPTQPSVPTNSPRFQSERTPSDEKIKSVTRKKIHKLAEKHQWYCISDVSWTQVEKSVQSTLGLGEGASRMQKRIRNLVRETGLIEMNKICN